MDLALIPPFRYLSHTWDQTFHLVLPHLLEYPVYAEYVEEASRDTSAYVILDNGLAEGKQIEPLALLAIASYYGVDELVVPDVMGDASATIERALNFMRVLFAESDDHPYLNRLAFVAQGANTEETLWCAQEFVDCSQFNGFAKTIMIPRRLVTSQEPHARLKVAERLFTWLGTLNDMVGIHFLGGSKHVPRELQVVAQDFPYVRSMDTSMPYVFAQQGADVEQPQVTQHRDTSEDYWHWSPSSSRYAELVSHNVKTMRKWAEGK